MLDTNTPHTHVDGEYADRRAHLRGGRRPARACRRCATSPTSTRRWRPCPTRSCSGASGTSSPRTPACARPRRCCGRGRVAELAPLLDASHTSMRDDFEITVPTVDLAVETARAAGAPGARMTGGGFGGCIIALVPTGRADAVAAAVADAFAAAGHAAPEHFVGVPSQGAHRARLRPPRFDQVSRLCTAAPRLRAVRGSSEVGTQRPPRRRPPEVGAPRRSPVRVSAAPRAPSGRGQRRSTCERTCKARPGHRLRRGPGAERLRLGLAERRARRRGRALGRR